LLFEMAAVLASIALGGVGEALNAPPALSVTIQGRLPALLPARPGEAEAAAPLGIDVSAGLGASVDVDVAALRTATGSNFLVGLSRLSAADLTAFVADNPTKIDALLAGPPAATAITGWWDALDAHERSALVAAAPRLVGTLEGVPLRARGQANLRYLRDTVSTVRLGLADPVDRATRDTLGRELDVLTQIRVALRSERNAPARSLILLDPKNGGRAAIALGDPDTADYVSYLVPGMNYGVEEQLVNWTATAEALRTEQTAVLAERAAPGTAVGSVATISWIGYRAPDLFSVGGMDRAEAGADHLEESWLGIRSARGAHQPFVSVFAHSYGSLVSLVALSRGSVEVDAFVMVGSPGSAIQSVDRLSVAHGNVYVGEADWDPAVNSAFFGSDPGAESYGAHPLGVRGAHDRLTGRWLDGSLGHNAYFTPGSESLHNMAVIGTNNAKLATNGSE